MSGTVVEVEDSSVETRTPSITGLSSSVILRDVATLGSGTLLSGVFGTLLVFLIPRLVSVENYGYWRLFLLYAGYVGLLHFGFADGALLQWAGKSFESFRKEIKPSIKFMILQQIAFVVSGSLVLLLLPARFQFIGIAVLLFALIMNLVTLLQYALQAGRIFTPVAVAVAAPNGIFVLCAFLWDLRGTPDFRDLIALYFLSWIGVLIYLWIRVKPASTAQVSSPWSIGKTFVAIGWPIVLANTGYMFVQSADRVVVSSILPISEFAQYSLATSAMFVPITAILTVYRVFFSHVAAVDESDRRKIYVHASRFLLAAWSLLLPYFFVLDWFVHAFLPNYVPSLSVAKVLLLGILFLAGIQILHMSFSYLNGKQRDFLLRTVYVLAATYSLLLALAFWMHSLFAVAIGQDIALALWWFVNEWKLRSTTGQSAKDWSRTGVVFVWSSGCYVLASGWIHRIVWQIPVYYALVFLALLLACREELRAGWRIFKFSLAGTR